MNNGMLPKKKYTGILTKKPDGLVYYQNKVVAFIEYKLPEELSTDRQIEAAIKQEIDVAKLYVRFLLLLMVRNHFG